MGALTLPSSINFSDWKVWALIAAAVVILLLLLNNTPKRQERSSALRKARAKYRSEQRKIREEFA